jgi:topoisomerase-4 subunit A
MYDINQTKQELKDIRKRLKEIRNNLSEITEYAISFLEKNILEKYRDMYPRRTEILSFEQINVREAAQRNLKLRYDPTTGYLGCEVNGNVLFDVSPYDRILVIRKTGAYSVMNAPEKIFVDRNMLYCGFADQENGDKIIFTVIYKNEKGYPFIKRCRIQKYIINKGYSIVPENCTALRVFTEEDGSVIVNYKPKPRLRILQETFKISDYAVKGVKARGVRLASREVKSVKFVNGLP